MSIQLNDTKIAIVVGIGMGSDPSALETAIQNFNQGMGEWGQWAASTGHVEATPMSIFDTVIPTSIDLETGAVNGYNIARTMYVAHTKLEGDDDSAQEFIVGLPE